MLLALVIAGELIAGQYPQHRLRLQPNLTRGGFAFFELAPTGGTGMGAACAGTAPTGAKGESVSTIRATAATCLKTVGTAPQLIAIGDLVKLSNNQPRVMPGADGTSINGILVETTGTNLALQSEHFENGAWLALNGGGASARVVTADFALAPDNTQTADRLQFSACSGADSYSFTYQTTAGANGTYDSSVFCSGTDGGSQTISVCNYGGSSGLLCTPVTFPGYPLYQRADVSSAITGSAGILLGCDNISSHSGHSNTGAADLVCWGTQNETGTRASSYIVTTSSSAVRNFDAVSVSGITLSGTTASFAATYLAPPTLASQAPLEFYKDGNNALELSVHSGKARGTFLQGGSSSTQDSNASITANASNRLAAYYDLTNKAACVGTVCNPTAASLTLETGSNTLYIGAEQAGTNAADGVIKQICLDPSPTLCSFFF